MADVSNTRYVADGCGSRVLLTSSRRTVRGERHDLVRIARWGSQRRSWRRCGYGATWYPVSRTHRLRETPPRRDEGEVVNQPERCRIHRNPLKHCNLSLTERVRSSREGIGCRQGLVGHGWLVPQRRGQARGVEDDQLSQQRKLYAEVNNAQREFDRLLGAPLPQLPRPALSSSEYSQRLHEAEARLRLAEERKRAFDAKNLRERHGAK